MILPKGITFNKDKNRYKAVYKGIFIGYYDNLADANGALKLVKVKYLHEKEIMLQNVKDFVTILKGGKDD